MKPSDAFLGVIDFFSNLVPGAIVTFLVINAKWNHPSNWPTIQYGSTEGWVVFLVAAYVLGHVIAGFASAVLDPLYDRTYARWRRASSKYVRSLSGNVSWQEVMRERLRHVLRKSNPDDELLKVAKVLKKEQLERLAEAAVVNADDISNTWSWAGTVVRSTLSAGASEIDGRSAQSKLFRSVTVVLPFVAVWTGSVNLAIIAGWVISVFLSVWLFMRLRWQATHLTYEYFIASNLFAPRRGKDV